MPGEEASQRGDARPDTDVPPADPSRAPAAVGKAGSTHLAADCQDADCDEHADPDTDAFEQNLERDSEKKPRGPWWKKALKIAGLLALATVMVIVLKGKLPTPADIGRALGRANWVWVAVAGVSLFASVAAFGAQQRSLLRSFGVSVTHRRIGAITLASTALTNTLPAGGAVAAGYAYRLYRASGSSRSTAATVMVLSGVLTIGSLVLLYGAWLGASAAMPLLLRQQGTHPVVTALIGLVIVIGIFLLIRWWSARARRTSVQDAPTPRFDRLEQRSAFWGRLAKDAVLTLRKAAHLQPRDWATALGCSSLKWLLEFFGLYACCLAMGLGDITVGQLAAVFLGVQVVRQIPFTPGGIGLIEGALLAALVTAGAGRAPAFAAVLIYRVLSAWILIPIGFATMAELKRRDAKRLGTSIV